MNFKRTELEKFRSFEGLLIDVRSPSEYYKGHMPNSINIPLFDNEERSIVGTSYKNKGREKAVLEGLKIIDKKLDTLLNNFFDCINSYKQKKLEFGMNEQTIRIYCARGGMRSQSISWLLEKFKYKTLSLKGGYKQYRKWTISNFAKQWNIIVIGGKTGTGKTKLIKLLEKYSYQSIDLEGYASHRGSTFGGLGMRAQPSNEHFENIISEKLNTFNKQQYIFVEAESANIGACKIPHDFFKQMKESPRIEIIRSESNRLNELINTYSKFSMEDLQESVLRIKKRLGPQRTKIAIDSIKEKRWDLVCKAVLDYYDKCYEYEKVGKNNIKLLDLTDMEYDKNILLLINNIL